MKYTDIDNNITFKEVEPAGIYYASGPIGLNGLHKTNGETITSISKELCLVNAIDIDWNGALVESDITLKTTGDLLRWIKDRQGSGGNVNLTIDSNGYWCLNGRSLNVKAQGEDGITPRIGNNGNWYIGDSDTGVSARGTQGNTISIISLLLTGTPIARIIENGVQKGTIFAPESTSDNYNHTALELTISRQELEIESLRNLYQDLLNSISNCCSGTSTEKQEPLLSFSSDNTSTNTLGILANKPALVNRDNLPITYNSTNTSVATVNSNGLVTVVGLGITVIKAIFSGNEEYYPKEIYYVLTVNISGGSELPQPSKLMVVSATSVQLSPIKNSTDLNSIVVNYDDNTLVSNLQIIDHSLDLDVTKIDSNNFSTVYFVAKKNNTDLNNNKSLGYVTLTDGSLEINITILLKKDYILDRTYSMPEEFYYDLATIGKGRWVENTEGEMVYISAFEEVHSILNAHDTQTLKPQLWASLYMSGVYVPTKYKWYKKTATGLIAEDTVYYETKNLNFYVIWHGNAGEYKNLLREIIYKPNINYSKGFIPSYSETWDVTGDLDGRMYLYVATTQTSVDEEDNNIRYYDVDAWLFRKSDGVSLYSYENKDIRYPEDNPIIDEVHETNVMIDWNEHGN